MTETLTALPVVPTKPSPVAGPAWDIALLFPEQGAISEAQYLKLTEHTRRLVEFSDGVIEVLPMPNEIHQNIILFLAGLMYFHTVKQDLGKVVVSPFKIKLRSGRFREPDISFIRKENFGRTNLAFWERPDLVVEVISEDNPNRDLITKRADYAEAGIREYWIIDPRVERITVLVLENGEYIQAAELIAGDSLKRAVVEGFEVLINDIFAAGRRS